MKIAYRIMACYGRREMVEAELKKLDGTDVKVFWDDRPDSERVGTSYTQLKCINDALSGEYTHLVLLQDDLLLVNRFDECVKRLIEARPMALWTLFCTRVQATDFSYSKPYARLFPADTWGPANVIPIPMLKKIMEFRQEYIPNYIYDDGLYLMYCMKNGMPVYTTRVALLQHLCPMNSTLGYNDKRKVSKVFAGEDVYDRINWDSREFKHYNTSRKDILEENVRKYGPTKTQEMPSKIRYIMRTVGNVDLSGYERDIPPIEFARDRKRNALDTMRLSLEMAGDDACVNMEDDIEVCDDFIARIEAEIRRRPRDVLQFFSMRKDDLTVGSRYINGGLFMMTQCFYLPAGMAKEILEFGIRTGEFESRKDGCDILVNRYLKANKIKYWNVCPNLVEHKQVKSRIDPRRSSKRQSFTFGR